MSATTPGPIAPHGGTLVDRLDHTLDRPPPAGGTAAPARA